MPTLTRIVTTVLTLGALVLTLPACRSDERKGQASVPDRDIKTVMEAHVNELMAVAGVTAVAIGALEDGTPCIKVYVENSNDEIKRRIPKELEGHPVVVEVSGEIRPMDGG